MHHPENLIAHLYNLIIYADCIISYTGHINTQLYMGFCYLRNGNISSKLSLSLLMVGI
jgi:hypothetical protein